ncbi:MULTISPECIES: ProQ/FinO family protein [unclassified Caballeronia]|uniref:ProQ/FinO family protein n=1 Tax=unclassified Caballeronia TaxID=2646786 RepID=UPI0032EAB27C
MGFEQLAALKLQLSQREEDSEATSPLVSAPVDAGQGIKGQKRPRTSVDGAARAVTILQRNFPRAFPRSPASKVPLKVGILRDLLARAATLRISERDIRNGVKLWCRGQRYWTCLVEGAVRVDLNGKNAGFVTTADAEYGASQENIRLARKREQIANIRRVRRR